MGIQAAEALRKKKDEIARVWESKMRKEIYAATQEAEPIIINTLPVYLEKIADILESEGPYKIEGMIAKVHGVERAKSTRFSLEHLLYEYDLLRECIFDIMEGENVLTPNDARLIRQVISRSQKEAAMGFSEVLESMREQFVLVLTHDLRGPLTAAKTSAEILLRLSDGNPKAAQLAKRIRENMDRADRMIHDLLDASRARMGEPLSLDEVEKVELRELAQSLIDELSARHGDRFLIEGSTTGFWSHDKIRRALYNLLDNAVKYGEPETPITIHMKSEHGRTRIDVHNFGSPIPPDEQKKLFQVHNRLRAAKSSNKRGWGIGLTLVKAVAEAHGGSVTVSSTKEGGTVFTLDILQDARKNPMGVVA